MKTIHLHLPRPIYACLLWACLAVFAHGQSPVPTSVTYQGRVSVNGTAFTGMGSFKFALVKQTAPPAETYETLWSNDGSSVNGIEPTAAVEGIAIQGGHYSVALGDTSLSGMSLALSATALASQEGLRLRVWFNDGTNGFQQLTPDVALGAVPYAQVAARVPDEAITGAMVARNTLSGDRLQDGTLATAQIAPGAITTSRLAPAYDPWAGEGDPEDPEGWIPDPVLTDPTKTFTITGNQISDGTIGSDDIDYSAIQSWHIGDQAILSWNIGNWAIKSWNIGYEAIESSNIGYGAVGSYHISDDSILSSDIFGGGGYRE